MKKIYTMEEAMDLIKDGDTIWVNAFAACASPVERYTFAGAGHALSYLVDKPRYIAMVLDFWERYGK